LGNLHTAPLIRKARAVLAGVFVFVLCPALFAQQEVIPLDSGFYDEIDALYIMAGLAPHSRARPWTKSEAIDALNLIDAAALNDDAKALFEEISGIARRPLRFSPTEGLGLNASLEAALEMYTHTNSEDYVIDSDWLYNYQKRRPLLKLSLEASINSWFYTFTDFQYGWNFFTEGRDKRVDLAKYPGGVGAIIPDGSPESINMRVYTEAYARNFTANIPERLNDFDLVFPKRAFFSFGGETWHLSLGRDRLSWGNGRSGNFSLDENHEFDNFLRFSAGKGIFRYEFLTTFYDRHIYADYLVGDGEKSRFFMLHRLDFRILKSLTLSLSEGIMYQDGGFNPVYLNPAYLFHNWTVRENFNSAINAELEWAFLPGWNFYSQTIIDQFTMPTEDPDEAPAWGLMIGVEHGRAVKMFNTPALLTLYIEGAYTSPVLYRRDLVDFMILNDDFQPDIKQSYEIYYTGYPYGGDAIVLQTGAKINAPEKWEAELRLFGMIHGKMNPFVSDNIDGENAKKYANIPDSTPSGSADEQEKTLALTLRGSAVLPVNVKFLEFSAWSEIDFITKWNKLMFSYDDINNNNFYNNINNLFYHKPGNSCDFQFSLGIGVKL